MDALEAAGGVRARGDTGSLNLAQVLLDGEQVVVPNEGAAAEAAPSGAAASPAPGAAAGVGLVNLNTATEVELETLPGIGPVLAAAIVEWRTQNGGFTSIEQLQDVSGIGPDDLRRSRAACSGVVAEGLLDVRLAVPVLSLWAGAWLAPLIAPEAVLFGALTLGLALAAGSRWVARLMIVVVALFLVGAASMSLRVLHLDAGPLSTWAAEQRRVDLTGVVTADPEFKQRQSFGGGDAHRFGSSYVLSVWSLPETRSTFVLRFWSLAMAMAGRTCASAKPCR